MNIAKWLVTLVLSVATIAQAADITENNSQLKFEKTPERIVALEYSFVDALVNMGITPVGIADDNDPQRIIPQLREKMGQYESVGTRSQPSLEAISALKPDLIIADVDRHQAVYADLQKIAPTIILNSRKGTFDELLAQAGFIAQVVGKSDEMQQKIATLKAKIKQVSSELPAGQKVLLGNSREKSFTVYSDASFSGGVLKALGLQLPDLKGKAYEEMIFERVLAEQPQWLFIAHFRGDGESLVRTWEKNPLWQSIPAVKDKQVGEVQPNVWARSRGLIAANVMIDDVLRIMGKHDAAQNKN